MTSPHLVLTSHQVRVVPLAIKTPTPPKPRNVNKATRRLLWDWPAEERRLILRFDYSSYAVPPTDGQYVTGVTQAQLEIAVERGWLTKESREERDLWGATNGYSSKTFIGHWWTRTAVKVREPVDRAAKPQNAEKYAAKYGFPWPVFDHWDRIQRSPWRAVRGITEKLGHKSLTTDFQYPVAVQTRTELANIRMALLVYFGVVEQGTTNASRRAQSMQQFGWLPRTIQMLSATGEGLYRLCLELLIEPIITADGQCTGFRAVDPEFARKELVDLTGNATTSLLTKYRDYTAKRRKVT